MAQSFRPQAIETLDTAVSLDDTLEADNEYTWWVHFGEVDPAVLSATLHARGAGTDLPGSGWQPAPVPGYLAGLEGYEPAGGEVWFLRTVVLPPVIDYPLALRLGQIDDCDRTYFNGRLIGQNGDWDSDLAQAFDLVRIYDIPLRALRPGQVNVILVRVKGYSNDAWGITRDTTAIGPARLLHDEYVTNNYRQMFFLIVYVTVGLYFLFLFLRRRVERENLFFAIFALSLVGYQYMKSQLRFGLDLSFVDAKRVEYYLLYLLAPSFYYFMRSYFEFPKTRFWYWWDRVIPVLFIPSVIGIILATLSNSAELWWSFQSRAQIVSLLVMGAMIFLLVYQVRRRQLDAYYMLAGFLVLIAGILGDMASSQGFINLPQLTGYSFFGFIVSLALILVNRFVRVNEEVEDLNQNLERKVTERTEQLNASLSQVQDLKVQQDGDYFLTSLLIGPLGGNFASSRNLSLELLVNQKKQFHFRKWEAEIGGDLCALYDIELRGRKYTVFLNGDAMGKSIQGAGGALVLGTVFKSVVTRTQMSSAAKQKYPEQWVKECFLELQNVFVAFDGYMLVSAVLGLVDDETGMLYYINAEHPEIVLYRGGRAEFLEGSRILRKFGIEDKIQNEITWSLATYRLQPGDVIFCGSDGRDDLLMGTSGDQRIINEDEYIFVRKVQEYPDSLHELAAALFAVGAQTDDLSLMRIGYMEDPPYRENNLSPEYVAARDAGHSRARAEDIAGAIEQLEAAYLIRDDQPADVALLAHLYRKKKNYARAAELYIRLSGLEPESNEHLMYASRMLKMTRLWNRAADFGERCRLRDPENVKNLLNLADIYRGLKNFERSRAILQLVLDRDPANKDALRIQAALPASEPS